MITSSALASLHYLALGIGMGAVFARGIALRKMIADTGSRLESMQRVLFADNAWGIAALLWIITGLLRAFAGYEKGTAFYLANPLFHLKLTLFALIFLLELKPMIVFIKWRIAQAKGRNIDNFSVLPRLKWMNDCEVVLIVVIVFVASAMARGITYN